MTMKFKIKQEIDPVSMGQVISFYGSISEFDIETLNLTQFDRLLVKECDTNESADYLLILEMLFRREKEQRETRKRKCC